MSTYKAAFIIPVSAKKILDEYGWSFETKDRLQVKVLDILKKNFFLREIEKYLGIEAYSGDGIKINVAYDENALIEEISIQLWTVSADELKNAFDNTDLKIEIFIPSEV
jgi:hypothetical protein